MTLSAAAQEPPESDVFGGIWSRPYRGLTLGLTLNVSFVAFEALAVSTVLPAVVRDLGGLNLYGWAFSAFMLTNLVGIVVAGGEADRRGPGGPFLIGIALFVLGLLLAGAAPAMLVVVASRAVQGFGAGILSSLAYVCIGRGYPEQARPRMLATLSSAWVVPGLVGPALAGMIADHVGWRWVFLGLAPLPILAALFAAPAMRQLAPTAAQGSDRRHVMDAVLLAVGAGLIMAGLGGKSALYALLIPSGIALAGPPLRRLLPPGTLTARGAMPSAIATVGLASLAFFGVDAFIPLALKMVRGQSLTVSGLALTAATITWTAGAWIQAHLAGRRSRRAVVTAGLLVMAAGILGCAVALSPAVPALTMALAWGVAGLGMGMAYSTGKVVVLDLAPAGQEGATSAAMQLADTLGAAIGTGTGGVVVGYASAGGRSPGPGILLVDALMALVIGVALVTASRMPGRREARSAAPVVPQQGE
jgi:MFS family permease